MRDALGDAYTKVLFWMHDACDDGTWRGDRRTVLWFKAWNAALDDEAEREGM